MSTMSAAVSFVRPNITWSIVLSILMILAGILAIVIPPVAGIAATLLIGWLLIFMGAAHVAFGWHTRTAGGSFWGILLGLVYIAVGLYMLVHPVAGLAALTLTLGAWLFVESILEFVLASRFRHLGGAAWLILDGVVTLILAFLIWMTWPSSSPWVIGTLIGISMVFSGTSRLMLLLTARRVLPAV